MNSSRNDSAYSIGVFSRMSPLYRVATQLKTLIAEGMPTVNVSAENTMFASRLWPDTLKHVAGPTRGTTAAQRDRRVRDEAVAEQRLARANVEIQLALITPIAGKIMM